jgi:hypothetical protein
MILDNAAIDRLAAYAKSIGAEGSALGIKSTVQPMQRVKDGATGVDYYGIANSTDIDLEDEVVVPSGADRAYIQANGKMFADHKYGQSDVVGKIRAYIPVMSGGSQSAWKVRFHLASTDAGMTAAKIIDELGGIGLSVGFFAKDYGPPSAEEKTLYGKGGTGPVVGRAGVGLVRVVHYLPPGEQGVPGSQGHLRRKARRPGRRTCDQRHDFPRWCPRFGTAHHPRTNRLPRPAHEAGRGRRR